jgi:hypothetical protein
VDSINDRLGVNGAAGLVDGYLQQAWGPLGSLVAAGLHRMAPDWFKNHRGNLWGGSDSASTSDPKSDEKRDRLRANANADMMRNNPDGRTVIGGPRATGAIPPGFAHQYLDDSYTAQGLKLGAFSPT